MISLRKTLSFGLAAVAASGLMLSANDALSISESQELTDLNGKDATISGNAEVHLTSKTPFTNASANLVGENAWLYFDEVKPSYVLANFLKNIKVDGVAADMASNVRLAQYRGGTVVIPHGYETYAKALTVYTEPNCQGKSKDVAIETFHNDLGEFDNNIRSFKLRKGFQVCLANNPDCSGFSRIYIADTEDLVVNELPEGFVTKDGSDKSFISFIRVCKHQWVSKKGWCGWNQDVLTFTNATHSYSWSADRPSDADVMDREFVPQRHHRGWPGFGTINAQTNVSHLLGDNEPDNQNDPKEQPSTPSQIIELWPYYIQSGLRVGSPAPTGIWGSWLGQFFNIADSLNYRVDFVVYHQYEATSDFASRINRAVSESKGRPVWVTEWNNGANWTTESWPDASGPQRDADCNIIYYKTVRDEKGNESEVVCSKDDEGAHTRDVSRPLTPNNAAKQLQYMKEALANQDALDKLERLHFYNAVQDARAVELGGKLTPAGKYFAEYNQKLAYTKKSEFEHTWKIAPPYPYIGYTDDFKTMKFTWYDHNGETGKAYVVYTSDKGDDGKWATWQETKTLELGKDYQAGENVVYEAPIDMKNERRYRVQAISYKGTKSLYSRVGYVVRDHVEGVPEVSGIAVDQYSIQLEWTRVPGARTYIVERRDADDAEFKQIANTAENKYKSGSLSAGHDYWFRVSAVNTGESTPVSEIIKVRTPVLTEAPEAVYNLFAAAGDGQVTLTWDKTYQSTWDIERAESAEGPWTSVKKGVSNTKHTDTKLENGKTYWYRLTPKRLTNTGKPCDPVSVTPTEGNNFYVPFAEGRGLTAREHHGAQHGTLVGACTWVADREGNPKGAIENNPAHKYSYIEFPNGIVKNLSDFTVSFWLANTGDKGRVFDFGTGQYASMLLDYGKNNTSGFRYKCRTSAKNVDCNFNYTLEKGKWYFITLTQKSGTVTLYVNGEKVGEKTGNPNPKDLGNTTQNWLGRSMWDSDAQGQYAYDDFYIFPRAFSAEEIKTLMETPSVNGIEEIAAGELSDGMAVYGFGSEITIVSDAPRTVSIYTLEGQLVRTVTVEEGTNTFSGFGKGVYVAGNHKVVL